jgi:hypothetical protein
MQFVCISKAEKTISWDWDFYRLNEKSLIYRLIIEMGCPVFVIAKRLDTSEAEIYRFLNGEKMSSETEKKLKLLWVDTKLRANHITPKK